MPQAKTSKKKPASKVGGGGVGTRVSKFNLKLVIPVVLVVAALGGFYIFQKSSASSYTFVDDYRKLYGSSTTRINNVAYMKPYTSGQRKGQVYSQMRDFNQPKNNGIINPVNTVCAHFRLLKPTAKVNIFVSNWGVMGTGYKSFSGSGNTFNICNYNISSYASGSNGKNMTVYVQTPDPDSIAVDTIYGKP